MSKNILVTGGAGFIGSNFLIYFCNKYRDYNVVNIDNLTYAGDLKNLKECNNLSNYKFVKGNICDKELIEKIFIEHHIDNVIHFAAESHVDNSIKNPFAFIESNILGTFNLIDTARKFWMEEPLKVRPEYKEHRFHHISTDEVYGTLGETGFFSEDTQYSPNSPYSASKASSDHIVRAYHHTFGINVTTSNCSNNYGPRQHPEKLIPRIITSCLHNEPIPVQGNGKAVRDWLYVLDHCKAVDLIFHMGKNGEVYNIGKKKKKNVLEIVKYVCDALDKRIPRKDGKSYNTLTSFVKARPGVDERYAIDSSKISNELGWKAEETFESGIEKTLEWYLKANVNE